MKRPWVRRALWPVTLAVLGYVFYTTPFAQLRQALAGAAGWTVPAVALSVGLVFLADVLATAKTFTWFAAPLSYRETLIIRGASYPVALVNYALGQGMFAYFLHARRGLPLRRSAATVLLVMGINLLLLLLVSSAALVLEDRSGRVMPAALGPHMAVVRLLIRIGFAGLAVYVALLVIRPPFLRRLPVLQVLFEAGLRGHGKALLVRAPHLAALIVFGLLYLRGFGVDVPVRQALVFLPIAFLVAAAPLPGQGFGVAQLIMREMFFPFAPGDLEAQRATVVAASLSGQVIAMLVQLIIGLVCLRTHLAAHARGAARALHDVEDGHA